MTKSLLELWAQIIAERHIEMHEGDIEETLQNGTVHRGRIWHVRVDKSYLAVRVSWIAAKRADGRWENTGVVQEFLYDLVGINGLCQTSAPVIDPNTGRISFAVHLGSVVIYPYYDSQRLPAEPHAL